MRLEEMVSPLLPVRARDKSFRIVWYKLELNSDVQVVRKSRKMSTDRWNRFRLKLRLPEPELSIDIVAMK